MDKKNKLDYCSRIKVEAIRNETFLGSDQYPCLRTYIERQNTPFRSRVTTLGSDPIKKR